MTAFVDAVVFFSVDSVVTELSLPSSLLVSFVDVEPSSVLPLLLLSLFVSVVLNKEAVFGCLDCCWGSVVASCSLFTLSSLVWALTERWWCLW